MQAAITFYNNKGGVSKTTSLFNVAVYLAHIKKRKVLLIDADSQCNLTELFFAPNDDFYSDPSYSLPGDSLLDIFRARLDGAAAKIDVTEIKVATSNIYKSLDIIRGDIEFSAQAEPYFGSAINQAITTNVNEKNTYVSFRRLVQDLFQLRGYDYIFIDLGPSSGAITRLVFLASHYFFVPVTPDRFCYLGVTTLPKLIESWIEHDQIVLKTLRPYGIEDDFSSPVFLGAINQNFQIHRSQIKESYQKWVRKIRTEIKTGLLNSKVIRIAKHFKSDSDPFICSIENIGQLAPVSQMLGKAVFDLRQEDTALASSSGTQFYGTVWAPWEKKIKTYKAEIAKIAKLIESEDE
jgi:cellulose biosynthesis protein BcsQ